MNLKLAFEITDLLTPQHDPRECVPLRMSVVGKHRLVRPAPSPGIYLRKEERECVCVCVVCMCVIRNTYYCWLALFTTRPFTHPLSLSFSLSRARAHALFHSVLTGWSSPLATLVGPAMAVNAIFFAILAFTILQSIAPPLRGPFRPHGVLWLSGKRSARAAMALSGSGKRGSLYFLMP